MASGIPRRKTARRRKGDWQLQNFSLIDVVAFRAGSFYGEKIDSIEALKAARKFHGCNLTGPLSLADRERLFPGRTWR